MLLADVRKLALDLLGRARGCERRLELGDVGGEGVALLLPDGEVLGRVDERHVELGVVAHGVEDLLEVGDRLVLEALLLAAELADVVEQRELVSADATHHDAVVVRDAHVSLRVLGVGAHERVRVGEAREVLEVAPARHGRVAHGEALVGEAARRDGRDALVVGAKLHAGGDAREVGALHLERLAGGVARAVGLLGRHDELRGACDLGAALKLREHERGELVVVEVDERAVVDLGKRAQAVAVHLELGGGDELAVLVEA